MSRKSSRFSDGPGLGSSKSSTPTLNSSPSTFSLSPVATAAVPSPSTSEASEDKESLEQPELLQWLKDFGLEGTAIPQKTLRTITRGPFKDFLYSFCLPHVRPTTWITTMRLNLDLIAERRAKAEGKKKNNLAKVTTEIEQCRKELEELEQTEQTLVEKLRADFSSLEESSILSLTKPKEAKIMKEVEKQYLESLMKSVELKKQFFQSLSSMNSNAVECSEILEVREISEDFEQLRNVDSIRQLKVLLCKLIPKFLGEEGSMSENEDSVDNIKKLKQLVLNALIRLKAVDIQQVYEAVDEISPGNISKLPEYEFSTGLSEFNKIIWKKLLEWSEAHVALFETNIILFDDSVNQCHNNSSLQNSATLSDSNELTDETANLKLLIEEEKGLEMLRFYQELDVDAYENLTTTKSELYVEGMLDNDTPKFRKSALPNYELLTEILLSSLPVLREGIEDGVNFAKKTAEEIHECFESVVSLITEDLQPPEN